ncbi:MAG TPA: penicillin acylase family protein, partial [Terriglobales bacterium]|nr:penicillin acylase family protein [Terriglobales bacterium]
MPNLALRSFAAVIAALTLSLTGCGDDDEQRFAAVATGSPAPSETPTLVRPTATPSIAPPSATPTVAPPSATPTVVPATATTVPTVVPSATATAIAPTTTAIPPSATATSVPPTATASPTATSDPNRIVIPGLEGEVEVIVDDYGFPHVYGPTTRAVIQAQGYLSASARFFEMDMFRRLAEGRLSEVLGLLTLDTDVAMRTSFTTRDGRRLEEAMWEHIQSVDAEVAAIIEAYTAGVNGWLDDLRAGRNGAQMPPEYTDGIVLNETPMSLADWRPQDVLAIARLQAWSLSETLNEDINFART